MGRERSDGLRLVVCFSGVSLALDPGREWHLRVPRLLALLVTTGFFIQGSDKTSQASACPDLRCHT